MKIHFIVHSFYKPKGFFVKCLGHVFFAICQLLIQTHLQDISVVSRRGQGKFILSSYSVPILNRLYILFLIGVICARDYWWRTQKLWSTLKITHIFVMPLTKLFLTNVTFVMAPSIRKIAKVGYGAKINKLKQLIQIWFLAFYLNFAAKSIVLILDPSTFFLKPWF